MDRPLLTGAWLPQFGAFGGSGGSGGGPVRVGATSPVGEQFHAEVHHDRVLGADFRYSAVIDGDWTDAGLCGDVQFRMSDEGRYGVRVNAGKVSLYKFALPDRPCDGPGVIAHCPKWDSPDVLVEQDLDSASFAPLAGALWVSVDALGPRLIVGFGRGTVELGRFQVFDHDPLRVGRFGLYVLSRTQGSSVTYSDVNAVADVTAASNFALLYSTPGYDSAGPKRLLVRTLNDVDSSDLDVSASSFTVTEVSGAIAPVRRSLLGGNGQNLNRAFGMQLLPGDFSEVHEPGTYTADVELATSSGMVRLRSSPFAIRDGLLSQTMLWPLTTLNAQARRAADESFRRNWFIESGPEAWSVGLDGAFVADRADDQAGATLRRVLDTGWPFTTGDRFLVERDFRFVCRVTIVEGCDAQLQFRIIDDIRWAVTLQAGAAGGCVHGGGPGAVRLHREGAAVPNQFEVLAAHGLDAEPFRTGRAYDVEVRATDSQIQVLLDGTSLFTYDDHEHDHQPGGFGLKAWGATVRFGHAKVWRRAVALSRPAPGVWIPYNRAAGLSSQGLPISGDAQDDDPGIGPSQDEDTSYPLAAQQHGFQDCNNFIGEVTSHGVFLATLMRVWQTRAHTAGVDEQDALRRAVLTAVLYLNELYEQGNRSGAFAHQEPGRDVLTPTPDHVLDTRFAMYGLAAFAAGGMAIDESWARQAFDLAASGWDWLDANQGRDPVFDSVVAAQLAAGAQQQGRPSRLWSDRAHENAQAVLARFAPAGAMANTPPDTVRSIPWFEGVYETFASAGVPLGADDRVRLGMIADQLEALLDDPANAFQVIPQSDWATLADLPQVNRPIPIAPDTVGDWYVCTHFLTAAADAAYIGRLAERPHLDRLATGNLSWAMGLNPGLPTTKTVGAGVDAGPWSAASFVHNGPGSFARTIEGWRTQRSSAKGWLADWEQSTGSRHRETWWIDPAPTGFQSVVNGHVLREGQWHYWSTGSSGWVSGETFLLSDACLVRAALALEDWRAGSGPTGPNPYDLTRVRGFDTTHLDRVGPWAFDDPDITSWAQAHRMATGFARSKGYSAGRLTGHHVGELVGVYCCPPTSTEVRTVPRDQIDNKNPAFPFPFDDIETTPWSQVGRAAIAIAPALGFAAGFFTGNLIDDAYEWVALSPDAVSIVDIANDDDAIVQSPWRFGTLDADLDSVTWTQAARLATDVCARKGFAAGFFSGHQLTGKRQLITLR